MKITIITGNELRGNHIMTLIKVESLILTKDKVQIVEELGFDREFRKVDLAHLYVANDEYTYCPLEECSLKEISDITNIEGDEHLLLKKLRLDHIYPIQSTTGFHYSHTRKPKQKLDFSFADHKLVKPE